MRQNTTNATLLGMTAAALGTSGSLPKHNPLDSVNLNASGSASRDITSFELGNQATLQNFGATFGEDPHQTTTRLVAFVKEDDKPAALAGKKAFPRKISESTEDFDNFEDAESTGLHWKVSGNTWADSAVLAGSGSAFNRRYSTRSDLQFLGFSGKSFALTANVSTKEQSKAISDEFTINTDRITFKIAGGANKEQTSFKLVVDDKIVFIATGENDFTFRSGEFPAAKYKGKTAHFEIEDKSSIQSAAGLIAVDDIRGINGVGPVYVPLWGGIGSAPFPFFDRSSEANRQIGDLHFGVSAKNFEVLINKIYIGMCSPEMDHKSSRGVEATSQLIKKKVESIVSNSGMSLTNLGKQWILAEGIGAWVRLHVKYSDELARPGMMRDEYVNSSYLLRMAVPKGVCSMYSVLVRDLSNSAGLTCYNVIGICKEFGGVAPVRDNHEWNTYLFPGDIYIPMDACQTHIEADVVLTKNGKIWRDSVLPKTPAEMELFLSKRFGRKSRDKVDLGRIELNGMDFNEWAVEPTADKADLRNLCNKAEDAFNHSR